MDGFLTRRLLVRHICFVFVFLSFSIVLLNPRLRTERARESFFKSISTVVSVPDHRNTVPAPKQFNLRYVFYHDIHNRHSIPLELLEIPQSARVLQNHGDEKLHSPEKLAVLSKQVPISRPKRLVNSNGVPNRFPKLLEQFDNSMSWVTDQVIGPDPSDRATVINLAKMTSDAYVLAPEQPGWLNTTMGFNRSYSFGWKHDGLRGHVFTDEANDTVIVAFKGTSIDPREKTRTQDRLNDNQLFSCCCATQRPDPYWYGPACECREDTYQCNSTCLTQTLLEKGHYYPTAIEVVQNVSSRYPNSNMWVIGHSMGGAMASLVGLTYGLPAVSFEAPPQKLAAERLGLTIPPETGAFHFGNTADPIYMGACNGFFSACSAAGYAFESQCFTGKRCVYDTVGDKGWRLSIANHRINTVITEVLETYETVPSCEIDDECVDCYSWKFDSL